MGIGRFANPHTKVLRKSFWHFLLWRFGFYDDDCASVLPPFDFTYPAKVKPLEKTNPSAVWIGHSTYLIELGGKNILTDPVWDDYCSPVPIKSLRRHRTPPVALANLPQIDIILISHNHYDHLDAKTVSALHRINPKIEWVVPSRLSPWFKRRGIQNVTELEWWQTKEIAGASITGVPSQHFSGRSFWDTNRTHWNGYVLEFASKRIYFTGDTGYNNRDFKEIGRKFGSMDLSLIPIGTYWPQAFMQPVHICPQEAVQIHEDVGSRFSLGMHWNTFRLSDEPMDRPPFDLYLAMKAKHLPLEAFLPVEQGIRVNF